jgi:hypothetical protein
MRRVERLSREACLGGHEGAIERPRRHTELAGDLLNGQPVIAEREGATETDPSRGTTHVDPVASGARHPRLRAFRETLALLLRDPCEDHHGEVPHRPGRIEPAFSEAHVSS